MAEVGAVIIYDDNGKIWHNSGEHAGAVLPNEYPVGLPFLELPYGTLANNEILHVNVTKAQHEIVKVARVVKPTYAQLEAELASMKGEIAPVE